MSDDRIPIDYDKIVHETVLSWLLKTSEGDVWFSKKLCSLEEEDGERYVLVPEWLAKEEGLI